MRQKHLNSDEEKLISDYLKQNKKIIDDSIQLIKHIPLMFKLADSMKNVKTEKDVQLFLHLFSFKTPILYENS